MKKHYNIGDAFEYYLKESRVSPSTVKGLVGLRDKIEMANLDRIPLKDIYPALILKFLNSMTECGEATIFLRYVQIKTIFNKFIRDHALPISLNLSKLIKRPKIKQIKTGEEPFLTFEEVKGLLEVNLEDRPKLERARDLFCFMCFTGLSVSDLMQFSPDWISENKKWLVYHRKKTGNKCEIPVLPVTYRLMKKLRWPCRVSIRTLQGYCKAISLLIGRDVTLHGARKTWGSVALEMGFSIQSVAAMLGHSSSQLTEKIYAKVTKQKIEREMREIPNGIRELMNID